MAAKDTIRTLRSILSELRRCRPEGSNLRETSQIKFLLSQYRDNQVTDQQYCKAQEEAKFMANTYLSYLHSKRKYLEILSQYHTKGERTFQETASQLGFKLPHDPNYVMYPFSSSFEEHKCSPAEFQLKGMRSCHALLKCEDFDNVRIGKLLGYGAVKAVYHAKWNDYDVALCTLNDPRYELDFLSGIQNIKEFQQNPFTVQAVGFCVEEKMFLTEFHKNGNASNIAQILRSSLGTLDNVRVRMSLCYNYAQILSSLHHPVKDGIELTPRVICDSNDLHKLLSQLLLTDNMTLILNDMDALPKVSSDGIKCGHHEIKGTFVAPEQLWKFSKNYDDDLMPGYDEKTDIWKAASVCEYFLDGVSEGEKVKTLLSPVHRRCRNVNPVNRPTANELLQYYATIMNAM